MSKKIEEKANQNKLIILGKVPYDLIVTKAMVEGKTIIEYSNNSISNEIKDIYHKITKEIDA